MNLTEMKPLNQHMAEQWVENIKARPCAAIDEALAWTVNDILRATLFIVIAAAMTGCTLLGAYVAVVTAWRWING